MDSEGQRGATTPSVMLASLISKRGKLHDELRNIEKQVYELETSYLQDPSQCGNVLKGFEGFLSSSKSTTLPRSKQSDGMTLVQGGLKVEVYYQMDKGNQRREEQHQGMLRESGNQVNQILTMKMILI
ncbi:uncharacterized protein LOC131156161 isoform X3 [Malania oleifera]|uniref:uncharacterized protein LOC131156161 isoform X3 n=1 Tax=Malania oleifera TaxID=397392 RepID=UPI0025AE889C|nr:uncharacterized protein LOC131156161 isoform X3 [Malania oleifera]